MSETATTVRTEIKPPSMWKVILHNDDFTPMDFVVQVLLQIFNKDISEATALMMTVHNTGRANVGLFTKEVAVTKVLLTERAAAAHNNPLLATCEEA